MLIKASIYISYIYVFTYMLAYKKIIINYRNVFVPGEEAIWEPCNSAQCEEEGEKEGHELHTLGSYHKSL